MLSFVLVLIWIGTAVPTLLWGLDYYMLPLEARAYSPLAPIFSPSGVVGQGLGIVGSAMIVLGVVGYAARKRIPALQGVGALKHWLEVHIFLCTLGPFFVLLHTTFRIGGLVSIAFWSMVAVVMSGVFGRYVYVRIPKTMQGRFLGQDVLQSRVEALTDRLRAVGEGLPGDLEELVTESTPATRMGMVPALVSAVGADFGLRRRQKRLRVRLRARRVSPAVQDEIVFIARERARRLREAALVLPFQRMFRYWHAFHLPLAGVMFLILAIHVAVALLFGYTWIF